MKFKSSLPCHTQAVERGVKHTTGILRRISGVKRQTGDSRGSNKKCLPKSAKFGILPRGLIMLEKKSCLLLIFQWSVET